MQIRLYCAFKTYNVQHEFVDYINYFDKKNYMLFIGAST